jgi:hypothetical protein
MALPVVAQGGVAVPVVAQRFGLPLAVADLAIDVQRLGVQVDGRR